MIPRLSHSHFFIRRLLLTLLVLALVIEGFFSIRFYFNVTSARDSLVALKSDLDLTTLANTEQDILEIRDKLEEARNKLDSANSHLARDPLFQLAKLLPGVSGQASALQDLLKAGEVSAETALTASNVVLDYTRQVDDPQLGAIQEGMAFLASQRSAVAEIRSGLEVMKSLRAEVDGGLIGPLDSAAEELDFAIDKLEGLVSGFERADALLPALLGFEGPRRYLVLAQNDTEIFPSGGLLSNYGIAVFDKGRISEIQFEYFVNLFRRWQEISGGEYIEPPKPLKNYLLRHVSFALGEAGWYPDFPTTATLAADFVYKGGALPVDGTIALDLQFVEAILKLLGPITVREYGIAVSAETLSDVTLEQTRNESAVPGAPGKSFLGFLAGELLERLFATTKEDWVDVVRLLDRMAKERHLQLNFQDERLQSLATAYGFDGALMAEPGDFIHLADTSVNSTKLNLILENRAAVQVALGAGGEANTTVAWHVFNPFPTWRQGRDPKLVEALMLQGVYGSYLRLYVPSGAHLASIHLDGKLAGAEQIGPELGKMVFGRFFTVRPGEARVVEYTYTTPGVVLHSEDGSSIYRLYVQKQPGTRAIPLRIGFLLPDGARLTGLTLDGEAVSGRTLETDLRTDRVIELRFKMEY